METTIVNEQIIIGKQTMSYVLLFVVYRLLFNFVEIMNLDVKLPSFLCLSGKLKQFIIQHHKTGIFLQKRFMGLLKIKKQCISLN